MTMDELTTKSVELEQRYKSAAHRLDKVEERQDNLDKLVASVEVLANRQETVECDVKEIKTDVKALTEKPAKRWESVIAAVITGVVGFIVAWALRGGA